MEAVMWCDIVEWGWKAWVKLSFVAALLVIIFGILFGFGQAIGLYAGSHVSYQIGLLPFFLDPAVKP